MDYRIFGYQIHTYVQRQSVYVLNLLNEQSNAIPDSFILSLLFLYFPVIL